MRKRGDTPGKIGQHFEIRSSSTVSTILGQSKKIIAEYEKNECCILLSAVKIAVLH